MASLSVVNPTPGSANVTTGGSVGQCGKSSLRTYGSDYVFSDERNDLVWGFPTMELLDITPASMEESSNGRTFPEAFYATRNEEIDSANLINVFSYNTWNPKATDRDDKRLSKYWKDPSIVGHEPADLSNIRLNIIIDRLVAAPKGSIGLLQEISYRHLSRRDIIERYDVYVNGGYNMSKHPREHERGVAVLIDRSLKLRFNKTTIFGTNIRCGVQCSLFLENEDMVIGCLHMCPRRFREQNASTYDQINDKIRLTLESGKEFIIGGDINIGWEGDVVFDVLAQHNAHIIRVLTARGKDMALHSPSIVATSYNVVSHYSERSLVHNWGARNGSAPSDHCVFGCFIAKA